MGLLRCNNAAGTPNIGNVPLPNTTDLVSKLASTIRLVKNTVEARSFLEQRSLIPIKGNCTVETLATLLISASFESKIPDITVNIMRAVALLVVGVTQNMFAKDLAVAITEKVSTAMDHLVRQMDSEREFLQATVLEQAKHTKQLGDITKALSDASLALSQNTISILETAEKLSPTVQTIATNTKALNKAMKEVQPVIQTIANTSEHITSLAESIKSLAKTINELHSAPPLAPQPSQTNSQPSYTNITAGNMQRPLAAPIPGLHKPEYIQQIKNHL